MLPDQSSPIAAGADDDVVVVVVIAVAGTQNYRLFIMEIKLKFQLPFNLSHY